MGPNADGSRRRPPGPAPETVADHGQNRADKPAASPPIEVRPARGSDAETVAALHVHGISEGFLSLLGTGFLRLLYRRISRHPAAFLLVADHQGAAVGFIAGSTDVTGLYRSFLWRDGVAAALSSLGPLVRGWRRVVETFRHGSSGGGGPAEGAELLSVAVDPSWQGRGAGHRLVASFLDEVAARGCQAAHVVVGADNGRAISLYQRAGFVTTERFELHPGTESLLMLWDITTRPPSSDIAG
jgi:ribosomal protein S18 acetylase RimI-like enzyme